MMTEAQKSGKLGQLRAPLCPEGALPDGTRMNVSLIEMDDGTVTCVKSCYNKVAMTLRTSKGLCHGTPYIWDYSRCADSDAVRKAIAHMVVNAPGNHWLYQVNRAKAIQRGGSQDELLSQPSGGGGNGRRAKNSGDKGWTATPQEIKNGIVYINFKAPLTNGANEQFLWVLLNLRDPDSPVFSWPMTYVQRAASNRSSNKSQVSTIILFPLLLFDYNETFMSDILPILVPCLITHALFICGVAGRGKTSPTQLLTSACDLNYFFVD